MKKTLKITSIVLAVILVVAGSLAIWQRKNIASIILGIKVSEEEIEKRRNENQMELIGELNNELETPLRELTNDEKQKVESGEITIVDAYAGIFAEKESQYAQDRPNDSTPLSKDEIISKYMSQLYNLQMEFTARAEATIKQGASYYESIKAHPQDAAARAKTISHYSPTVRNIEAECDKKVDEVIKNLESELKGINVNTDIVRTIKETYENEKQLKLSYYANKYLK